MKTRNITQETGNVKTFFLFFFMFFLLPFLSYLFCDGGGSLFAQAPQGFNYQAVVRDANGQIMKDQNIGMRLSILQGSENGGVVYSETWQLTTTAQGLVSLTVGKGNVVSGDFSVIDWDHGPYYLKVEADLSGGNNYETLGISALMSVPYALQAGNVGNLTRLNIQGDDVLSDSALFEVKRKDGQTVFAVYNEGVRVYVDDNAKKGPRGGFAIGGFDAGKGITYEYMRVTPDSVNINLRNPVKGPRGGFAIGGFDAAKGMPRDYLRVTRDSTRVYVSNTGKGPRGGFAIGGYDINKGPAKEFFNVSTGSSVDAVNPSEPRILWYPQKEAFLAGRVLVESPDSVGLNSLATGFESKAEGDYSQAMGYRTVAKGNFSLAMGDSSVTQGDNSLAMGYRSFSKGLNSFSFGNGAQALGDGCYAIGSYKVDTGGILLHTAPTIANGIYSVAIGQGATTSNGFANFSFGAGANASSKRYSLAIGHNAVATGEEAVSLGNMGTYSVPPFMMLVYSPNVASGYRTMALGFANHADSAYSVCLGTANQTMGYYGTAVGYRNKVYGWYSVAAGLDLQAQAYNAFVVGTLNQPGGDSSRWVDTDPLFVVGNGYRNLGSTIRRNAFVVYKNGNAYVQNRLGIGTQDPQALLHVTSAGDMSEVILSPGAVNQSSQIKLSETPAGSIGMSVQYDGSSNQLKVLGYSGTYIYGEWLKINRNDGEMQMPQVYNQQVGASPRPLYIDNTGKIGFLSSSRRYKRDIHTMEDVNWLYRLHPVNFEYKSDETGIKQYGLIAEEVEKVNPLFVSYNEKGQVETVSYSQLITPMLKALQEQHKEIERLKAENSELAALRREVNELKRLIGTMAVNK